MGSTDGRYLRHPDGFGNDRRQQTAVLEYNGHSAPDTSKLMVTGLASAGSSLISSDYPGRQYSDQQWLWFSHDRLTAHLNGDVAFQHLDRDPGVHARTLVRLYGAYENLWMVVHGNDPEAAIDVLEPLVEAGFDIPVMVPFTGQSGLLVYRHPDPGCALVQLQPIAKRAPLTPAQELEVAEITAGILTNEIMLGGTVAGDDLGSSRVIGFYSLNRSGRRRVMFAADEPLDDLLDEIARPSAPSTRRVFSGKRITLVGGGALGNFASIPIAKDGHVTLVIIDGDTAELHNLARQPLLVGHLDDPKARAVAYELGRFTHGTYRGLQQYVGEGKDLASIECDALVGATDTNGSRAICGQSAWERKLPFVQGGTSATGGQMTVVEPGRACLECLTSITLDSEGETSERSSENSCSQVAEDSVVSSNMVVAGLMVSELRQSLGGRRSENLRFHGTGGGGNRLTWEISDPLCPHVASSGSRSPH